MATRPEMTGDRDNNRAMRWGILIVIVLVIGAIFAFFRTGGEAPGEPAPPMGQSAPPPASDGGTGMAPGTGGTGSTDPNAPANGLPSTPGTGTANTPGGSSGTGTGTDSGASGSGTGAAGTPGSADPANGNSPPATGGSGSSQ